MTFMIWPKGSLNIISKAIGELLLRTLYWASNEQQWQYFCPHFNGQCRALCEIVGRINTASPRISSIQDNLTQQIGHPHPKHLMWMTSSCGLFAACILFSLLPGKSVKCVGKHKAVLFNFSSPSHYLIKVITWELQISITRTSHHITTLL